MREILPTKTEALALGDERKLMRDGFGFLDEKRMLLAGEMIHRVRELEEKLAELDRASLAARAALGDAIERHGLDELQMLPPPFPALAAPSLLSSSLLGVALNAVASAAPTEPTSLLDGVETALTGSASLVTAAMAFRRLALLSGEVGVIVANLERLVREYKRVERRANALESVLIPEVEEALKTVTEQLESFDQEETIRARMAGTTLHQR